MDRLIEEIKDKVSDYFLDYTINADIPERAENAIDELVGVLMEDIGDLIINTKSDVDSIIEEFTPEELENIKADIKYQDEKEADLWN